MSSYFDTNQFTAEAEALSTSWPVRRMAAELPQDLRLALLNDDSRIIDASFMNRANAQFRKLATADEQGLLLTIGGTYRGLRLALLDLGFGAWSVDDVEQDRLDAELDDIDFDSVADPVDDELGEVAELLKQHDLRGGLDRLNAIESPDLGGAYVAVDANGGVIARSGLIDAEVDRQVGELTVMGYVSVRTVSAVQS